MPIYPKVDKSANETKVTVLPNGLRVASQPKFGQFCTVGVVIDAGSRKELGFKSGMTHFLEKLSFNRTSSFESKEHILAELEKYGGICDCQGSRDSLIYAASIDSRGLESIVKILGEVSLRPSFTEEDLKIIRQIVQFELEDISMRADQEPILLDLIHAAAFRSNTLGLPKLCPPENISTITAPMLYNFLQLHHTPSRMVLAGVGVQHEELVEYAQKYFVDESPIWKNNSSLVSDAKISHVDESLAQYTGGVKRLEKDLSNLCPGPSPLPELAHFILGFESAPHQNLDEYIPTCVLSTMMGGGGSFSAGGPGKGMYTRLYTNVMIQHYWFYNATAYNHAYQDGGVFCVHASADPRKLPDVVEIIGRECRDMQEPIDEVELKRAKAQLQSMLLMNLEARPVLFEDIARQVLANGHHRNAQFFLDAIDKVSQQDVRRVAERMLKSKISVAALGDTSRLPSNEEIEQTLTSQSGRRYNIFRYK